MDQQLDLEFGFMKTPYEVLNKGLFEKQKLKTNWIF